MLTDLVYMMVVPDPRVHNDPCSSDELLFSNCVTGGGGGSINELGWQLKREHCYGGDTVATKARP